MGSADISGSYVGPAHSHKSIRDPSSCLDAWITFWWIKAIKYERPCGEVTFDVFCFGISVSSLKCPLKVPMGTWSGSMTKQPKCITSWRNVKPGGCLQARNGKREKKMRGVQAGGLQCHPLGWEWRLSGKWELLHGPFEAVTVPEFRELQSGLRSWSLSS